MFKNMVLEEETNKLLKVVFLVVSSAVRIISKLKAFIMLNESVMTFCALDSKSKLNALQF